VLLKPGVLVVEVFNVIALKAGVGLVAANHHFLFMTAAIFQYTAKGRRNGHPAFGVNCCNDNAAVINQHEN
jgi:hypothetical protein